jgi:hypothetical protein
VAIACILTVRVPAQQPTVQSPATAGSAFPTGALAGTWDYNDDLSVNAATGRVEQAPLSATPRPRRGSGAQSTGTASAAGGGLASDDLERAAMVMFVEERRALVRDLLEVAETLTIRVTGTSVTFVDDLDRERTYPTDGKMHKYQLGAAQFEARATWDGSRLRKDIEGANNFRMSEVYFLIDDGSRMVVVIRIGDPRKPETNFGVNRVYDRIKDGSDGYDGDDG